MTIRHTSKPQKLCGGLVFTENSFGSHLSATHIALSTTQQAHLACTIFFMTLRMPCHRSLGQRFQKHLTRLRRLLEQRHAETLVHVSDGCGEADFRPGTGTLQGNGRAAQLFLEPYHPQLDKWANDLGFFMRVKPYTRRVKSSMGRSSKIWRCRRTQLMSVGFHWGSIRRHYIRL